MNRLIVYLIGIATGVVVTLGVVVAGSVQGIMQSKLSSPMLIQTESGFEAKLYPGMPADSVIAVAGSPQHVVHTWALWKHYDVWMYDRSGLAVLLMADSKLHSVYGTANRHNKTQVPPGVGETCVTDTIEEAKELPLQ